MPRFVPPSLLLLAVAALLPLHAGDKGAPPNVAVTFKGHKDAVYAVAFSPDGKYLATGSFDNSLKLWDAATASEIRTFAGPQGHTKQVLTVAFSPDGMSIASGGADNTVKVWDVPSTSPLRNLAHSDALNGLALSVDGTKLATAGKDGTVILWGAGDFKQLFKTAGHQGPATSVAFSANGQLLASSGADRTVRFWNVANGQPIATLGAHASGVNAVAINPNNTQAYSVGDDGLLKFWQVPPPPSRALAGADGTLALTLSPDGSQVLAAGTDKSVRGYVFANGQANRQLTGPAAAVSAVAMSASGALIAGGTADSRLFIWNAADNKVISQTIAHGGPVTGVSFLPNNAQLLTSGSDGLVKVWAMPPLPPRTLTHPDAVTASVGSVDGKRLVTGSADKILRSWDAIKGAVERQFTGHAQPITAVALSANNQLLASADAEGLIRFWDQATGKETVTLGAHAGPVTSLAINPATNQMLSASEDGTLKLWTLPIAPPRALMHPDKVTHAVLTPDGAKLLTAGADKIVRLWNVQSSAKEREYAGLGLPVTALAVSADGQRLAGAGADKLLIVWGLGDGKELKKLMLPTVANAVAFSPDGKTLAAGLADNSVRLFDPNDGKELKNLASHKAPVSSLVYAAKGELISASADKGVQIWGADGAPQKRLELPSAVTALALSKDGTKLAAAADKLVKVWNVADSKDIASITSPAVVQGIAFAADGNRLALAGADNRARIHALDGSLLEFFAHEGPVQAVAFTNDGKNLVTASADKTARVWTGALALRQAVGAPVKQAVYSPKGDQVVLAADKQVKILAAGDGKVVKELPAHDGPVVGLALSADATRLATIGDKTLKVWTVADGKPVAALPLPNPAVSVALAPNGQRVAVGESQSNVIRVFDIALGREILLIPEHTGPVPSLAFQADNRTLVSASADKSARFFDVGVLAVLDAHKGGVVGVQVHSNGTQAVTAGADNTVKLWDLAKNQVVKTFGPLQEPIHAVTYNRDFTQVGVAAGKVVRVWNLADGKEVLVLTHPADVGSLSFSVDKTRVATGSEDKVMRLWDVATGKEVQFFPQPEAVKAVLYHPTNTAVLSGGKALSIDNPAAQRVIPVSPGPVHALALTPTGTHVLTAGTDKVVSMWNIASGAKERTFAGATDTLLAVAVSKNNTLVAAGGNDKMVRVFNLADGKEIKSVAVPAAVRDLAFSSNNLALVAACADKSVLGFNTPAPTAPLSADFLKPLQGFAHAEASTAVAFAPDNVTIYSASLDKTVKAWKLAADLPTKNFPHPNIVDAVAFSPNAPLLATGGHDGKLRLFDLVKGALVKEINAHATVNMTMIYAVAFSPDGKHLVSASYDNSLKLWDVPAGNLVREFKAYKVKEFEKGHQDSIFSVAFSPDGKLLASGSGGLERVVKLWNVTDGNVIRDFDNAKIKRAQPTPAQSHPGWVYGLRFTKDGKRLVSVGDAPGNKGYVALWNVDDGKMLSGEEMTLGTFYSLALAPDEKLLAVGAGPRGRATGEFNNAYLLKMPEVK